METRVIYHTLILAAIFYITQYVYLVNNGRQVKTGPRVPAINNIHAQTMVAYTTHDKKTPCNYYQNVTEQ